MIYTHIYMYVYMYRLYIACVHVWLLKTINAAVALRVHSKSIIGGTISHRFIFPFLATPLWFPPPKLNYVGHYSCDTPRPAQSPRRRIDRDQKRRWIGRRQRLMNNGNYYLTVVRNFIVLYMPVCYFRRRGTRFTSAATFIIWYPYILTYVY